MRTYYFSADDYENRGGPPPTPDDYAPPPPAALEGALADVARIMASSTDDDAAVRRGGLAEMAALAVGHYARTQPGATTGERLVLASRALCRALDAVGAPADLLLDVCAAVVAAVIPPPGVRAAGVAS